MTKEQLEILYQNINAEERNESQYSIGLRNVNSRLKLKYGEQSRLNISSTPEEGTMITFLIPCQRMKEYGEKEK